MRMSSAVLLCILQGRRSAKLNRDNYAPGRTLETYGIVTVDFSNCITFATYPGRGSGAPTPCGRGSGPPTQSAICGAVLQIACKSVAQCREYQV